MSDQCSDERLAAAVAASRSWRGVLRFLGLPDHSAYRLRAVREHAARIAIDQTHFTGQRTWTDAHLVQAVAEATDWAGVLSRLGLSPVGGGSLAAVRLSAVRLGLDVDHLRRREAQTTNLFAAKADVENLRLAGSVLAASWFLLRGYSVAWPLEPCRYDLLVEADATTWRVQVKTTSHPSTVTLACSKRHGSRLYQADEIDAFFIVDRVLDAYLVPFDRVAGLGLISLRKYRAFRVATAGNWLQAPAAA